MWVTHNISVIKMQMDFPPAHDFLKMQFLRRSGVMIFGQQHDLTHSKQSVGLWMVHGHEQSLKKERCARCVEEKKS